MNRPSAALRAVLLGAAGLLFSACQRRIVYVDGDIGQNRDIYVSTLNPMTGTPGAPVAVAAQAADETPCGALKDGRIVFSRQNPQPTGWDVLAVKPDGTGESTLLASPSDDVCAAVLSDDTLLVSMSGPKGLHDLAVVPPGATQYREIARDPQDEIFRAVAPDGRIVYLRGDLGGDDILSISTASGATAALLAQRYPAVQNIPPPQFLAVTADNRVIFSRGTQLYSVKTDGSRPAQLTEAAPSLNGPNDRENGFCAAAPDGRVFFTHHYIGGFPGQGLAEASVYAVNGDGTGLTLLQKQTGFNDVCAGLVEDRVVFARIADRTPAALYGLTADGSKQEVLLSTGANIGFERAAGSRAIFGRNDPNGRMIYSVKKDGTGLVRLSDLTPPAAFSGGLFGNRVIFYVYDGVTAFNDIYIVDAAGGTPEAVGKSKRIKSLAFVVY